ncbi:response regulator transcription factor [Muribaculum intestinale]|uniref:response regulator transcription factor n=1 Tax=Muribaculum intestinale TaxID=1796646 RepID=UPI00242D9E88|nr:helix-turn-helix transcriptional regulator [Muribaculum intestinale]
MDTFRRLDTIMRNQPQSPACTDRMEVERYAEAIATMENVVAVLSDLKAGTSRIFHGAFGDSIGLRRYISENSIWEKEILELIPEADREEKYLAELRFYNFLRHMPRGRRHVYFLAAKLRFLPRGVSPVDVLHRMYYIYTPDGDALSHALCLYGPQAFDFPGRSVAVNSVTGQLHPLTSASDDSILSRREKQVLELIDMGRSSREIADTLSISVHTVSRHRQEILAKLQVKNSAEACRLARSLSIITR